MMTSIRLSRQHCLRASGVTGLPLCSSDTNNPPHQISEDAALTYSNSKTSMMALLL